MTTDNGGNWVAVWSSTEALGWIGTDTDILVARSTDNGATWTAPAALNTNAAIDSGGDRFSQLATDRAGHWVVVWDSDDALSGTIGTDYDILYAKEPVGAVGGLAELPAVSDSSGPNYALLAALAAAALVALTAGAWYSRRRWLG